MFQFVGRLVGRGWPWLLAGWILLLLTGWFLAPSWYDVAQDKAFSFLPPESPSIVAENKYAKAYPDQKLGSNIVLVLHRYPPSAEGETPAAKAAEIARGKDFIQKILEPA